eukprot:scaffold1505_cov256-Pinguiococcus_pyrenoidosus.AAC.12
MSGKKLFDGLHGMYTIPSYCPRPWIAGVLDSAGHGRAKHELEARDVALRSVGHEDLIWLDDSIVQLRRDLLPQVALALLRSVATVGVLLAELGSTTDEAAEDVLRDGLGRVT